MTCSYTNDHHRSRRTRQRFMGPTLMLAAADAVLEKLQQIQREDRHSEQGPAEDEPKDDIIDTAVKAGSFKTLAEALGAADLVDTLKGEGPFTVFAPTDAAFDKLPEGTIEDLLKPENKEKLSNILTYHVVSGEVLAGDLLKLTTTDSLNGGSLNVGLRVNEAAVVQPDIKASNGVIHVIDTVMLPPEKSDA